jgi:HAD superfamily hydrolase (TIGR01490 family)
METHIFDVDHTIVRCSTVREFIFEGLKEGAIPLSIGFYAVYFFLIYNLWGPRQAHFERQYPFFRNISETTLEKLSEATFARRIRPRLDRAIALRIASILSESGRVMLASSSFSFILKPLARHLGVAEMVASELELRDGVTTGRLSNAPAYRRDKKDRVALYLEERGRSLADCAFYSDSVHDLPLLRAVGRPIAVNPDAALKRVARSEGWEIVST